MMYKKQLTYVFLFYSFFTVNIHAQDTEILRSIFEAEVSNVTKTWTRWWWMGSAVDKENIKSCLVELNKAGIGGVEITPIYGVMGEEDNYLQYLSPEWMKMLNYTIEIADSLGMQVDIPLGTGWPYGGPQVTKHYAATKLEFKKIILEKGAKLDQTVILDKSENPEDLLYVLAYDNNSNFTDLTDNVNNGNFNWKAKKDYNVYTVFIGKTKQQVKRAAPGGEGFTLDHYSKEAFNEYVKPFDEAFKNINGKLRAIFNDSYEVYNTDFTPAFFQEFQERRKYDLKPYLHLLLDKTNSDAANRIRSDYRETLSDLLLENFAKPWTNWVNQKNYKTRYQAHGSPGNLIDLNASADIPECETFGSMPFDIPGYRRELENIRQGDADPIMLKFSSSSANISGKKLVSAEAFTWLREHFKTALSHCKPEVEDLFLNGVNHVFLHGNTYSPHRAEWPGWKFYASVNFSPNNTIWEDAPAMFNYINRCQALLQTGNPDNDVLLYWPIYDVWDMYLNGDLFFQFKIHSLDTWLNKTAFYHIAKNLRNNGYSVDFISDSFINTAEVKNGMIKVPGGEYKSLVIPDCKKMPLATFKKLIKLKEEGASIIFENLPESVPGFYEYELQNAELNSYKKSLKTSNDILESLEIAHVKPERLVKTGLKYIKRDINGSKIYYLVNHTPKTINEYIPLETKAKQVIVYDPLNNLYGSAAINVKDDNTYAKIYLEPGQSIFLKTQLNFNASIDKWNYYESSDKTYELKGEWSVKFIEGGPKLPEKAVMDSLHSWTLLNKDAEAFSGTAAYEINFNNPDIEIENWQLNLGDVRESAKIWLNNKYLGTVWSVPFSIQLGKLKKGENILKIEVTNLAANRLRSLELNGKEWKIFHEINMVNKDYETFDATKWNPEPSGILGPVTISPLQIIKE